MYTQQTPVSQVIASYLGNIIADAKVSRVRFEITKYTDDILEFLVNQGVNPDNLYVVESPSRGIRSLFSASCPNDALNAVDRIFDIPW